MCGVFNKCEYTAVNIQMHKQTAMAKHTFRTYAIDNPHGRIWFQLLFMIIIIFVVENVDEEYVRCSNIINECKQKYCCSLLKLLMG
jgi:hypothetical protein